MPLPQDFIDRLKAANPIDEVMGSYVTLKRAGRDYVCLCPFHNEKTPSCHVHTDKEFFHCFGCGAGGDVITFVMKYHNLDYWEAVKMLAERGNVPLPETTPGYSDRTGQTRKRMYEMNKDAANRLLKLIEEPPKLTEFILITHNPEQVLVTIASRCQRIRLAPENGAGSFEDSEFIGLLRPLMQGLLARDLYACLEIADSMANLSSKEKAKNFCKFAAENLRYIFLLQQGMPSLVTVNDPARRTELEDWAGRSRKTFARKALDAMGRAEMLISRNVNLKILFTDLVNGLYESI